MANSSLELVPTHNQGREIDEYSDSLKTVRTYWRKIDGVDHVFSHVIPHNGTADLRVEIDPAHVLEEEHHLYPVVAQAAGHLAARRALGIELVEDRQTVAV